jgi:uncharacterized protein with von Willebrand factor type A (vWA) domain
LIIPFLKIEFKKNSYSILKMSDNEFEPEEQFDDDVEEDEEEDEEEAEDMEDMEDIEDGSLLAKRMAAARKAQGKGN